jgi:hypothetical protein
MMRPFTMPLLRAMQMSSIHTLIFHSNSDRVGNATYYVFRNDSERLIPSVKRR